VPSELPDLTVPDAPAWRRWLEAECERSVGVRLLLAKKGTTHPTRLTHDAALLEALCFGWIDGQLQRVDGATFRQRFTPRRSRSGWSRRNVELVEQLTADGRMHPRGLAEVERARSDGRWEAAYDGARTIAVPDDLAVALAAEPAAQAMFEILTSQNRYAVLYRIDQAKRPDTRARRIADFVAMLARGETVHPQRRQRPDPSC
jgi:uncharacterized protein YdeI (YjbR/CyaY-like superfamily)